MDNQRIFSFLTEQISAGQKCVLVTVVAVSGSSMRNPGAHMAVCDDGDFVGSLSGGCIENAVVSEALDTLNANAVRVTRFGAGSPYIDIKLPCGGGMDIHFQPLHDGDFVDACVDAISSRRPFSISLHKHANICAQHDGFQATSYDAESDDIIIGHWPAPKFLIIGHGAVVESLSRLATAMNIEISILSPDADMCARLASKQISAHMLSHIGDIDHVKADAWTAIIFLFHDHDWEIKLMAHALRQPHFYLGAMGGRKAHVFRSGALLDAGIPQEKIDTIHAPIGLFHSSRDPDTLALSALAQVMKSYHGADFSEAAPHIDECT